MQRSVLILTILYLCLPTTSSAQKPQEVDSALRNQALSIAEDYWLRAAGNYTFRMEVVDDADNSINVYTRQVDCLLYDFSEDNCTYLLFCYKYDFKGHNNTPLIKKLSSAFDMLQIKVDRDGRIVAVLEKEKLKNNWEDLKIKILKSYGEKAVTDYLNNMDDLIANDNRLFSFLEEGKMYGMFLKGIGLQHSFNKIMAKNTQHPGAITEFSSMPSSSENGVTYLFKNNHLIKCRETSIKESVNKVAENGKSSIKRYKYEVTYNGKAKKLTPIYK